jgi:hypothetical protein
MSASSAGNVCVVGFLGDNSPLSPQGEWDTDAAMEWNARATTFISSYNPGLQSMERIFGRQSRDQRRVTQIEKESPGPDFFYLISHH